MTVSVGVTLNLSEDDYFDAPSFDGEPLQVCSVHIAWNGTGVAVRPIKAFRYRLDGTPGMSPDSVAYDFEVPQYLLDRGRDLIRQELADTLALVDHFIAEGVT